jgi:hypothetical protein
MIFFTIFMNLFYDFFTIFMDFFTIFMDSGSNFDLDTMYLCNIIFYTKTITKIFNYTSYEAV